jgi:hypothetical protein
MVAANTSFGSQLVDRAYPNRAVSRPLMSPPAALAIPATQAKVEVEADSVVVVLKVLVLAKVFALEEVFAFKETEDPVEVEDAFDVTHTNSLPGCSDPHFQTIWRLNHSAFGSS